MKNNTLNKWKSAYEKREIIPAGDLWSQLEQKLDGQPGRSQKPFLQWWSYAAALLLMVSIISLICFNLKNTGSGQKKAAPVVTKIPTAPANPVYPDVLDRANLPESGETVKETQIVSADQKSNGESILVSKMEKPVMVADRQPDADTQETYKAETANTETPQPSPLMQTTGKPLIAESKRQDPGYIHADELLLGREIDRLNENRDREERRFGVFNLKKVVPKVEKVTVLGVKVYIDPK